MVANLLVRSQTKRTRRCSKDALDSWDVQIFRKADVTEGSI